MFQPWLEALAQMLRGELHEVAKSEPRCAGIFLIGGGADQPAVLPYLQEVVVDRLNEEPEFHMQVKIMKSPLT